jgi:hypothetical protein
MKEGWLYIQGGLFQVFSGFLPEWARRDYEVFRIRRK